MGVSHLGFGLVASLGESGILEFNLDQMESSMKKQIETTQKELLQNEFDMNWPQKMNYV